MARKLGVNATQRIALIKNQASALLWYGKIETTEARAKEVRKFVEKMITYGKDGSLVSRRKALAFFHNDNDVVSKIFNDLAKKYETRNGGYTRIIKLNERRGDDALEVRLELV